MKTKLSDEFKLHMRIQDKRSELVQRVLIYVVRTRIDVNK